MIDAFTYYRVLEGAQLIANLAIMGLFWHFCVSRDTIWHRFAYRWRSRLPGFDLGQYVGEEFPLIGMAITAYPPTEEDIKLVRDLAYRYRWEVAKEFDVGEDGRNGENRQIVRECEKFLERWG